LKAYKENSNLAIFNKVLGTPENPIDKADETALFQIINQLNPVIIVDESHHARTKLSWEMLQNFNPAFVLDLTATPKKESNIISYTDAIQLKKEHMVKLPVIVYNRDRQEDVLIDAIDLRRNLEEIAKKQQEATGRYIRPIVLFQAQPKSKEEAATFEKLRQKLVEAGIPAEEIAIRTADVNELKNVDLLSPKCKIRFIITVNALKEGWDCPFAYILASLANRTSQIDVEQILGRILRLPYTAANIEKPLNMSYVLTSSENFQETIKRIVKGLNDAGFSDEDYRLSNQVALSAAQATGQMTMSLTLPDLPQAETVTDIQTGTLATEENDEEFFEGFGYFDSASVSEALERRQAEKVAAATSGEEQAKSQALLMLEEASRASRSYDEALENAAKNNFSLGKVPAREVRAQVKAYPVKAKFREDIENLRLPQFFLKIPEGSLFEQDGEAFLERESLVKGISFRQETSCIDFEEDDKDEIMQIDVIEGEGGLPKALMMKSRDVALFKEYFDSLPPERRIAYCKAIILEKINRLNMVSSRHLEEYIGRIVADMKRDQLSRLEKNPLRYADKIKQTIQDILAKRYKKAFNTQLAAGKIVCHPSYQLPIAIAPARVTSAYARSLYKAEEEMNSLETELVLRLTNLNNIRWWHRNLANTGFFINGFTKHYPDFIIKTENGNIVLVETKGEHLANEDSKLKINLGRSWSAAAGDQFKYFMVFADAEKALDGAFGMSEFIDILKEL
ncbi:MAG: DEAD/DEAH box helicase, partial [Candidatus Bruticola sp.]